MPACSRSVSQESAAQTFREPVTFDGKISGADIPNHGFFWCTSSVVSPCLPILEMKRRVRPTERTNEHGEQVRVSASRIPGKLRMDDRFAPKGSCVVVRYCPARACHSMICSMCIYLFSS